jgi:hypothetical protein
MSQEMMRVIDFDESSQKLRFVAKHGIDPELDKSTSSVSLCYVGTMYVKYFQTSNQEIEWNSEVI